MQAGAFGNVLNLLAAAEAGPLDEFVSARADLLRGHVAFASSRGSEAPPLLLKAAKRLEPLNRDLARDTYLTAWIAATYAGRLASAGHLQEVCRAAQALPRRNRPPALSTCCSKVLPCWARKARPPRPRRCGARCVPLPAKTSP